MREACGYSKSPVMTVLGLIGVILFIPCIIGLAAGVTWVVVKLSPSKSFQKPPEPSP
jgi:hypothetical protein